MIADFIHIFKKYYITGGGAKSAIFEICGNLFSLCGPVPGPAPASPFAAVPAPERPRSVPVGPFQP